MAYKYSIQPNFAHYSHMITEYARLADEYGCSDIQNLLNQIEENLKNTLDSLKLKVENSSSQIEPNEYEKILVLRPDGPRKLDGLTIEKYREKLKGAFYSRMAGCTLGAPVEAWSVEQMEDWAKYCGIEYPCTDYWPRLKNNNEIRYLKSVFDDYAKPNLKHVPCDDDTCYTLLALLIAEEKGIDFNTKDVAEVWQKYVTMAYSAEYTAWNNINLGIDANVAGEKDNPYVQWLGANIRCDGFGYMAAGNPELAAKMAYYDAFLSHRRNGIYSSMFFAATIAAAFVVDDPFKALEIGLTEIPKDCEFARDVKWALEIGPNVKDYKHANKLVKERFGNMSIVHSNDNAALTIFGLFIGKDDIAKAFSNTVAMAYDNDCTAATTGSIAGAAYGIEKLDKHWYELFNNKFRCYFNGPEFYEIDNLLTRFEKQYEKTLSL